MCNIYLEKVIRYKVVDTAIAARQNSPNVLMVSSRRLQKTYIFPSVDILFNIIE
jgi:hypothetical protein